jgi:hypothetical protein
VIFTFHIWKVLVSLAKTRGVATVAVRALVEICIDDIPAVLRATDLRIRLPFVSCPCIIDAPHTQNFEISRANSGVKKNKISFEMFVIMLDVKMLFLELFQNQLQHQTSYSDLDNF